MQRAGKSPGSPPYRVASSFAAIRVARLRRTALVRVRQDGKAERDVVMFQSTQERVRQELRKLVGLELTATARAADLRGFHFGKLRPYGARAVGEFALHVQCA